MEEIAGSTDAFSSRHYFLHLTILGLRYRWLASNDVLQVWRVRKKIIKLHISKRYLSCKQDELKHTAKCMTIRSLKKRQISDHHWYDQSQCPPFCILILSYSISLPTLTYHKKQARTISHLQRIMQLKLLAFSEGEKPSSYGRDRKNKD